MCYSGQPPPSSTPVEDERITCSQYCLCFLGVGLVSVGVVMVSLQPKLWDSNNDSRWDRNHKTNWKLFPVEFILVGGGVVMLMLSVCLGVRNKQRHEHNLHMQDHTVTTEQRGATEALEEAPRYDVPSYEEAVASGQYPIQQNNLRSSSSQLPSYDELVESRVVAGPLAAIGRETLVPSSSLAASEFVHLIHPGYQDIHAACKPLPLREKRIHSENLHLDESPALSDPLILEPLTPPPQYEETPPEF